MKYLLPLLLAFYCLSSNAQNILTNGSFEQYTNCSMGPFTNSTNWRPYTSGGSPDYYNSCGPAMVPTNWIGTQTPAHGNAYAGFSAYTPNNFYEYVATSFPPLTPGFTYEISISASLADVSGFGVNGLGVYFYDGGPATITMPGVCLSVTPQVSFSSYGPQTNTTGWNRLVGTFVADSTYDNLVIGGFLAPSAATIVTNPGGSSGYAYYYIDSVVLKTSDSLKLQFTGNMLCGADSFMVPYVASTGLFNSGNVFTVQLSNASGSFATPINIGSKAATTGGTIKVGLPSSLTPGTGYRMRVVASNIVFASTDNGTDIAIAMTPPVKPVAASNNPVCEGNTITLSATTTSSVTGWSWTGPNNFSSTVSNPSINNATQPLSGIYIVKALNYGCISSDTELVTIIPNPIVVAASNSPVCEGVTLNLSASNAGAGAGYSWTGPAGFSAGIQNPALTNITSAQAGDYVVTATLSGCTARDTVTVQTKLMPAVPVVSVSGPSCIGGSLNLTAASSTSGVNYNWTGPLSFTSTTQNPIITNTTTSMSGVYSVTATLNGCTSAAGATVATVHLYPATPTASSSTPVCAGGTSNLSANSITPGVNYNWTGPNGFTSTAQNPSISPAPLNGSGIYSVTAEANGCVSPAGSTNVTINNVSSLGVYPSPNDTLCINNANANFVSVPFNAGTAPQYQWFKNNTLIGGATSITYPATGIADGDSFYCRMTVTGLCADPLILYSNKVGMTVLPLTAGPTVSITADPGTLLSPWQLVKFTAVATNAGTLPKYQWKRNGQDVIGATSNVWSANNLSNLDTISCIVTSDVWCASPASNFSNRMVVNIKTGISDIDADRKLELFPNPNNGSFVVNIPTFKGGNLRVDVVDALGRTVYRDQLQTANHQLEIALPASVANGVYMLKLGVDGAVYHARFTVGR
ncbi:T9SS type A sorting domain-containing protein [Polluticoccus soli]|uniref:Ig-like domain-containing protein n=1 Tax=Polluticoccus soli TaxID=3034150 RepID=UPI0023E1E6F7|nr:T9SS type A sorting domain-containing protein [Flavipsychrobacter sp. JY13-12]